MSPFLDESSVWELESQGEYKQLDKVGVFLVSLAHHRRLSCDESGNLSTVVPTMDHGRASETWQLKPSLPLGNDNPWVTVSHNVTTTCSVGAAVVIIFWTVLHDVTVRTIADQALAYLLSSAVIVEPLSVGCLRNFCNLLVALLPRG